MWTERNAVDFTIVRLDLADRLFTNFIVLFSVLNVSHTETHTNRERGRGREGGREGGRERERERESERARERPPPGWPPCLEVPWRRLLLARLRLN